MLSVTGLNKFYYIKNFTDMRCKYGRVLSVIRRQLGREPEEGDVFVVMSRNRRLVRLFAYDRISCTLFEKRFMSDYEFMRVEYDGEQDGLARSGDASGEPCAQAPAPEVKFFSIFLRLRRGRSRRGVSVPLPTPQRAPALPRKSPECPLA